MIPLRSVALGQQCLGNKLTTPGIRFDSVLAGTERDQKSVSRPARGAQWNGTWEVKWTREEIEQRAKRFWQEWTDEIASRHGDERIRMEALASWLEATLSAYRRGRSKRRERC